MSCLFLQNRHSARRCMARYTTWMMPVGKSLRDIPEGGRR